MVRNLMIAALLAGTAMSAAADTGNNPHNVFGTFAIPDGSSYITIDDCGDGSPCGRISWLSPETLGPGDTADTVVSAAGEKIMGLLMLEGFKKKKRDWRGGTIYDPGEDKTYASRMKRLENGSLELKGCIGPFCQTQIWTEVAQVEAVSDTASTGEAGPTSETAN